MKRKLKRLIVKVRPKTLENFILIQCESKQSFKTSEEAKAYHTMHQDRNPQKGVWIIVDNSNNKAIKYL